LSSDDALLLVGWLEDEVPLAHILLALERAATARRRTPSRIPLRLGHARRHLGRPTRGLFSKQSPPASGEPCFAPVVRALRAHPERDLVQRDLEATLLAIPGRDEAAVQQAIGVARRFFDARWAALTPAARAVRVAGAHDRLGDIVHLVDAATVAALAEEAARDALREGYPALTAATLWELVDGA